MEQVTIQFWADFWSEYEKIMEDASGRLLAVFARFGGVLTSGWWFVPVVDAGLLVSLLEETLDILESILGAVISSALRASLLALGNSGVDQPPFTSKVITLREAFAWALEGIADEFLLDRSQSPPNSAELAARLSDVGSIRKVFKVFTGALDVTPFISEKIARFFRVTLPLKAAALFGAVVRLFTVILVLQILVGMLKRRDSLIARSLGQSVPRQRVRLVGGGSINRREPGGNP